MTDEMSRETFFELLRGLPLSDRSQVQVAYWLARNAHHDQTPRDNGDDYFEHPRQVAVILIKRGYRDKNIVTLALLHDVVEDTNTPLGVIVDLFPDVVWKWLYVLSKSAPFFDPITGQLHDRTKKPVDKYYAAISAEDPPVRLVKLADRLHNLGTMSLWDQARRDKYLAETEQYILPIAEQTDPWFAEEIGKAIAAARRIATAT